MTGPADVAELLNAELSLLAFQRRVLSLAEDPSVPLLERLRFLGIVTSNIDELYMVRMAELRLAALDERAAGEHAALPTFGESHTASARLEAVEHELAEILAAQSRCADQCLREAARAGVGLLTWDALTGAEREALRTRYLEEIQPDLMPHAITLSPGHPLPHLPHLGLFVAVVFRAAAGERARLAEHELPGDVPRLLPVPGRPDSVIAIEDVLRANAHLLHPNAVVDGTYLFRVTRGGDLRILEEDSGDLLGAVASAAERRPNNPAVRVEVERSMPAHVGALILDSLRREAIGRDMELTVDAVQVVDGLLDQRCLQTLPLPRDARFEYPPFTARVPIDAGQSLFDAIRDGDLLVHHPFESFDATVVRFLQDAASDPAVTVIKTTLYRVGNPSPVVEALLTAAQAGKQVFALVELQARFDEEHNVHWARTLERAGGRVVYGLPGLKVHAKVALVVRREGTQLSRYVHVGTGNYNTRSGRQYTDLSLFSAREDIATDVANLFGEFAVASPLPNGLAHGALVAPHQLLPALLQRIEREAEHARAGRSAHIAIKVNGLADTEVVRALYRASQAGVTIDLVVRGICTLRPGVPGQSDRIRVVSIVGRFLEHSRIYRFANDDRPEYFIGSSDLRPRNLRRRVELLVPVPDAAHRARLDAILDRYLHDPTAWELTMSGAYHKRSGEGRAAQVSLAEKRP
ncbi:MAG: polyphosphate kinase 1 [Gemmatimonadaceae bacterium]|nr:polyphosphate kinase 1 [Gemmatimonadaceae bacterium]